MSITYLAHPVRGGIHIAYDDDEVRRCTDDGWISYGSVHPAEGGKPLAEQPQKSAEPSPYELPKMPDEPAQRVVKRGPGRPRKAK